MRSSIFIVALFISSIAFSQNTIVGKWTPVYFTMDKIMTADVKADTFYVSDTLNVLLKDDEDPKESMKMMHLLFEMMLEGMKDVQDEFTGSGAYIETNTHSKKVKTGTYSFDKIKNELITKINSATEKYAVSFKGDHLLLTGQLGEGAESRGVLEIEYERIKD
ncbi:MAG: hypothetical protein V4556_05760 [Bacteroidota bacterium]